jgi:hypothetical protein
MRAHRTVCLGFVCATVVSGRAAGQSTYDGCVNNQGQAVGSEPTTNLQDVAMATRAPNGEPIIYYNPQVLAGLSRQSRLFWYGHECGHHALGHGVRGHPLTHEQEADCFGIVAVVELGLVRKTDVRIVQNEISRAGGDWSHLPGPQRAINLTQCLRDAGITIVNPPGRNSCRYARDGTCDEPALCNRGTDYDDCRGDDVVGPPPPRVATHCVTNWGSCPMGRAKPVGASCICFTQNGQFPGVAQ